jgi:uncharacterized protein YkwD
MERIFPIDRVPFLKRVLALVGCTVALASLTLVPATAQEPTDEQLRALEAQVLVLVNQEREKVGVPSLALSQELGDAARRHSRDMATHNFLSHFGSDGSDPDTRIKDAGYQFLETGEDCAAGFTSAEEAVNGWMNSAGHRETLLRPTLKEIGIAIEYNANTDFGSYWTADFGAR